MFRNQGSKVRKADHAGTWYSANGTALQAELEKYYNDAPDNFHGEQAPVKHARIIIAPHAGYRYSGPTAGVAYKALDLGPGIKNVFVLGPSHHIYLEDASVSSCDELATPLGNLKVNRQYSNELLKQDHFMTVHKRDEEAEHSIEMQLPWVKFLIDKAFPNASIEQQPTVTTIMIGNTGKATERALGEKLAPFLEDPSNVFVVSSDFAHWGKRFRYTYYLPKNKSEPQGGFNLVKDSEVQQGTEIHESIKNVDEICMKSITTGSFDLFHHALECTHNTVCGRHPIGVMLAALEVLKKQFKLHEDMSRFVFTDYSRSGLVHDVSDSSVSYASAYAKIECMSMFDFLAQVEQLQQENDDSDDDEQQHHRHHPIDLFAGDAYEHARRLDWGTNDSVNGAFPDDFKRPPTFEDAGEEWNAGPNESNRTITGWDESEVGMHESEYKRFVQTVNRRGRINGGIW